MRRAFSPKIDRPKAVATRRLTALARPLEIFENCMIFRMNPESGEIFPFLNQFLGISAKIVLHD
jgi:hypothetical protein